MSKSAKWAVEQQLEIARDKLFGVVQYYGLMPSRTPEEEISRAELLAGYQAEVDEWTQVLVKLESELVRRALCE